MQNKLLNRSFCFSIASVKISQIVSKQGKVQWRTKEVFIWRDVPKKKAAQEQSRPQPTMAGPRSESLAPEKEYISGNHIIKHKSVTTLLELNV